MRHRARFGLQLRAISVTALVMAHLGTSAAPAWAQGGATLSSAAAAALGEYQAIESGSGNPAAVPGQPQEHQPPSGRALNAGRLACPR